MIPKGLESILFEWEDAKFPDSVLDYDFDWSTQLAEGEELEGEPVVTGDGVTVDSSATTGNITKAWLSGGDPVKGDGKVNYLATTNAQRKIGIQGRVRVAAR